MSIEEFADLSSTGYQGGSGEQIAPEDEFFHSVYVAGKSRNNHINIKEESGKFQIRGVQYNLDEVHMIITHTKEILANIKNDKGKDNIMCFSFKDSGPPWYGTSKLGDGSQRQCPQSSAERAVNDFCNPCRAQIIVAGIHCKPDGTPILNEDGKPVFIFIRGRGMRYPNISNYLNDLYKEDLPPLFEPVTEQSKRFEKSVVNNKRFVTNITAGQETSGYGSSVNVFVLNKGVQLPNESVMSILKLSKKTVDQFNEKFNWSKNKQVSGYGTTPSNQPPSGVMTVEDSNSSTPEETPGDTATAVKTEEKAKEAGAQKTFSFDDINF
jgi:hypothetical protein